MSRNIRLRGHSGRRVGAGVDYQIILQRMNRPLVIEDDSTIASFIEKDASLSLVPQVDDVFEDACEASRLQSEDVEEVEETFIRNSWWIGRPVSSRASRPAG